MNKRPAFFLAGLLGLALLGFHLPLAAQEEAAVLDAVDCAECHEMEVPEGWVHAEEACTDCHAGITQSPPIGPDGEAMDHEEPVAAEACDSCHGRSAKAVSRSVHESVEDCADCHGAAHEIIEASVPSSLLAPEKQIETCGNCHEDIKGNYMESIHARALMLSGLDDAAPSCTDCHGTHIIRPMDDDKSKTHPAQIPETCGDCHSGVLRTWLAESAHGMGWEAGDQNTPVCSDCHQSHNIKQPIGEARLYYSHECGDCHDALYTSYEGSFHGQATSLGWEASAICSDCHTPHANLPADDPRSSIHPDNLAETCGSCHGETTEAFLTFDPHMNPSDPTRNIYVYWIFIFMTSLLLGVFGFFFLHDALWLQRSLVGLARGEFQSRPAGEGPHIRRFNKRQMWTHITVVTTFLLLAATGLPIKFHSADWAQAMVNVFGGLEPARLIHRIAAIATFGYAAYHLVDIFVNHFRKNGFRIFWGPDSLVPQPRDVKEFFLNMRWFLYLGKRPEGDRWSYWEKFDYMAVFWGVPIIGGSGLLLWFPNFFTQFLPGWTLNAAHVVHSDEALLATGFIFVFHFFHTHLRPESFPMDPVMFTGRMPLDRFKEERGEEYERLVESGELESRIVDAPTERERRWAYTFGFIALTTGVILAISIFWALFGLLLH